MVTADMRESLDIAPTLSRHVPVGMKDKTAAPLEDGSESESESKSLNGKEVDHEESKSEVEQDFPWRWKLIALVLGIFLSGE